MNSILALLVVTSAAFAGDTRSASISLATDYEVATDCEWTGDADAAPALICYDDNGYISESFTILCGDGTSVTYLGGGPGNGCNSAAAINECRAHRGCVSVQ